MRYYALRKSRYCHDLKRYAALRISVAATSCANSTSQTDFGRARSGTSVIDPKLAIEAHENRTLKCPLSGWYSDEATGPA
jgi:hypothetical protein